MKKLFTHIDLDGHSCSIVANVAFGKDNVEITNTNYDTVNEDIKYFLNNSDLGNYSTIYITDISVNEEVADLLNEVNKTTNVLLFDHHPTAEFLNKYDWCSVLIEKNGEKTCGTSLFFEHLLETKQFQFDSDSDVLLNLFRYTEIVRKYDTWLWKTKYNDSEPKDYNGLMYIIGKTDYIDTMTDRILNSIINLDKSELRLLELEQRKIDSYIENKDKSILSKDILGYKTGIVFAEMYHSELGNKLSENHPEFNFIVIINIDKSISYRTVKTNVDLGKDIAKVFGGGGHPQAAGSPVTNEFKNELINKLFNL